MEYAKAWDENVTPEEKDAERQEAIDLVSFGQIGRVRCPNCGEWRAVGYDDTFPYLVDTCRVCGDDGYDLLDEQDI